MIDELTDQVLDMIITNPKVKEKIYPAAYCFLFFNILVLLLVIYMCIKVHYIHNMLKR